MKTIVAALAALAAVAATAVHADAGPGEWEAHLAAGEADAWVRWGEEFRHDMQASMGTLFASHVGSRKVVKGAPYSAEVVTETNEPLADGNVISHATRGAFYRDGEGRTRQETGGADGKPRSVFIQDVVAGKRYISIPGARHSFVVPEPPYGGKPGTHREEVVRIDGTEVRVADGKAFVDGKEVDPATVHLRSKAGKEIRIADGHVVVDGKRASALEPGQHRVVVNTHGRDQDGMVREEVRVQVLRSGDDPQAMAPVPPVPPLPPLPPGEIHAPIAPLPPMPGVSTLRFESTARLGTGVTTSLGSKEIEGLRAEGTSTTWTIPAGQIGNRLPIRIVSESWYSPDLLVTLYSRYRDPRTGESIYRLANIKRGEPPAELFKPPKDR